MLNYDFDYFVNTVKHLDSQDIENTVSQQLAKTGYKGKKKDAQEFEAKLAGLLFWIKTGKRSPDLLERDFEKLKPICESLVAKHQMVPTRLKAFQA